MRTRAGIVLIEDNKVALIERHRSVMEESETPEQATVREAKDELGIDDHINQKIITIHFGQSTRVY